VIVFVLPWPCGNGSAFLFASRGRELDFSGDRTFSALGNAVVGRCSEPEEGY
jgi:hypothetical protein